MEGWKVAIQNLSTNSDTDCFLYSGRVERTGYNTLSSLLSSRRLQSNALLILSTTGGDPDAGYRTARALLHHYGSFKVLIPQLCKSAGTLICLGASELILADKSELGPLDVQIRKPDELSEMYSGLDLIQSLGYMQTQAMNAFRTYLLELKHQAGLNTRTAAEIATKLATGLFSPIYGQVDPSRLGEVSRIMQIAIAYGQRLGAKSNNLKDGALNRLVVDYPSHAFVIDRSEAKELFNNVRRPEGDERAIVEWVNNAHGLSASAPSIVVDLNVLAQQGNAPDENTGVETTGDVTNLDETSPSGDSDGTDQPIGS